jgi:cellulose synthase/poly-beta-1,6-N-acetylglucosamine synthase-like glycosyltransferase
MIALQIIFWLSVFIVFHSYVLYPLMIRVLAGRKTISYSDCEEKPLVSIIMSLFNEETVIEEKLNSIISSNYPKEKIRIIIGSDNSTDRTNEIVKQYAEKDKRIYFKAFTSRQGKSNVINQLVEKTEGDIFILTDANVFFDKETISELVKPFSLPEIGLVDSHMTNTGLKKEGISFQEKSYISREVKIKHYESILWGTMMGPFGGCFAIRRELFHPVPSTFLVDDFYICMKVLEKSYKAVNNLDAFVYEDVSNNLSDEFRRKVRIATGDFQNLKEFRGLLWPPYKGLAFSFLSHKVLRWITPIFMIIALAMLAVMAVYSQFYLILLIAYCFVALLPVLDFLLKKLNVHNILLRFITHFLSMNIALLAGMFKFFKGVKSNVWKPTKRNQ